MTEDTDIFLSLADSIIQNSSIENGRTIFVDGDNFTIAIIKKKRKQYGNLSDRAKTRTNNDFKSIISLLGMETQDVLNLVTSKSFILKNELKEMLWTESSNIYKRLKDIGFPRPLSALQSAALLLTREYTENDIIFFRRLYGILPNVKKIRNARTTLLTTLPTMHTLNFGEEEWIPRNDQIGDISSKSVRKIQCARINLIESLKSYLLNAQSTNLWPEPPSITDVPDEDFQNALVFQLSLDTGGGTCKLMGKFVKKQGGQTVSDILLLSETQGILETNKDLDRAFSSYRVDILSLVNHGIDVNGRNYKVRVFFVGDFKIYYAALGMHSAVSARPCPWCCTSIQKMDVHFTQLSSSDIIPRPPAADLSKSSEGTMWQKAGTKDVLHLSNGIVLVPPPLHIKLGIINKILSSLDLVVVELENLYNLTHTDVNRFKDLLASSLSQIGVRREKYYCGKMAGVPCSNLMQNMSQFCSNFFHTHLENNRKVVEDLPDLVALETGLKVLANAWNDSSDGLSRGLGFFFHFQGKWTTAMLTQWDIVYEKFFDGIKNYIYRPVKKKGDLLTCQPWKVPMRMPKYHALGIHVKEFVKKTGYWGLFSEECFEHYQQTNKYMRDRHSHNISLGGQICRDLQYSWLRSLPIVASLQGEGEDIALANGYRSRKRLFSTTTEK